MTKTINLYNETKVNISKGMTGLFFEDINYSADGGLYAEMLENRNFEFYRSHQGDKNGDFFTEYEGLYGWNNEDRGTMKIVSGSPVSEVNSHYLRFTSTGCGEGFSNKAYDGICMKKDQKYKVSFYARNVTLLDEVYIRVLGQDGISCGGTTFSLYKNEENTLCPWKKYEGIITAEKDIRFGKFLVTVSGEGIIEFDFFSMIPCDAVCGIFRKDLYDLIDAIHPGFIRFPGGCIIEGATLSNRYDFKKTITRLEDRKSNWSRWAVHKSWHNLKDNRGPVCYPYYNQTYGIGYYEFFLLCESLGCKALPVLNVGLSCQFQNYEMVMPGTAEFDQYVQDALDLIEFSNGPVTSKYGKMRAELGHKESFNLEMMGIGNEQWETNDNRFYDRYVAFEKAIHKVYPDMKLIASAGPNVEWPEFGEAWDFIYKNSKQNPDFAYAVDEHYYMPPQWFYSHMDFYDNYDRSVKVFAGEYATHNEGGGSFNKPELNDLGGALAEASFLTGVERNADVVALTSYAPLFARLGYTQWSPDLIWFNDEKSFGTPSYFVQLMYSNFTGDKTLDTKGEHADLYKEGIYYNPSIDSKTGTVYLKIANSNDDDVKINLSADSFGFKKMKKVWIGGKEKSASNSIDNISAVTMETTEEEKYTDEIILKKNSFTVLILN